MEKLTYTVNEAAEVLSISRSLMYQLIKREDFPSVKIGNRRLVSKAGLEAWLEKQTLTTEETMTYD